MCKHSSSILCAQRLGEGSVVAGLLVVILLGVEGILGHLIEMYHRLIGILHNQILTIRLLHHNIDKATQHTPRIVHVQIDLCGKLLRLELLHAQYNMTQMIFA